jgi:small subunit ribosomal protein S20
LANTKSAEKAQRQNVRRAARNRSTRSAIRTYYKKAVTAVGEAEQSAAEQVRQAVRALDKAARKGIIHPNNAGRRKSRLMSRLHALTVAQAAPPPEPVEQAPAPTTRGRRTTAARATTTRRRTTTSSTSASSTTRRRSSSSS